MKGRTRKGLLHIILQQRAAASMSLLWSEPMNSFGYLVNKRWSLQVYSCVKDPMEYYILLSKTLCTYIIESIHMATSKRCNFTLKLFSTKARNDCWLFISILKEKYVLLYINNGKTCILCRENNNKMYEVKLEFSKLISIYSRDIVKAPSFYM